MCSLLVRLCVGKLLFLANIAGLYRKILQAMGITIHHADYICPEKVGII